MKNFLLALFIVPMFQTSLAQTKSEQQLLIAVESLRVAMVNADSDVLNKLTDERLNYGHSDGMIEDKKIFIGNLASGKHDFVTLELTGQTVSIKENTAIVRHHLSAKTNDGGKEGSANLSVLQVWIKEKGQWKLFARQAVKIPVSS